MRNIFRNNLGLKTYKKRKVYGITVASRIKHDEKFFVLEQQFNSQIPLIEKIFHGFRNNSGSCHR
jgi:hypothetical protein